MACSKLFSLPEVSINIIQNLRNNVKTLHSLSLVNRFWCRLAIPLLWEDPFSVEYQGNLNSHFLDTYFLFLNDDDKNKVKENLNPFKFVSNLQQPLFNYPSLIKTLSFSRVKYHVAKWFYSNNTTYFTLTSPSINFIKIRMANERKKVIFTILIKLFIENNASLSNLYIHISPRNRLFYYVCDMILDNPKFISDIEMFSFGYLSSFRSIQKIESILTFLSSLFISIKHIKYINISTNKVEFEKTFTNIIQSQTQLFSIKTKFPILNSLKHSSNTLTSINFSSCNFSNTMEFDALYYLTQLESLQFKSCEGLNSKVFQPFLNINTPLKIKTFVFTGNIIKEPIPIQLLIQKIGPYLENLVLSIYGDELREILFNAVVDIVCGKIKFLHLNYIDFMNVPQLSKMINNFNNHLKYLTLEKTDKFNAIGYDCKENLKLSSMILKELSKLLPLSLNYLNLCLVINPNDLQVFFENYKQVELKKLLIRNWSNDNIDTTFNIIKDFVKEKNVEFLAYSTENAKLVEETQSLIKLIQYDDLVIKVSDIDGNLIIS